jgi:L-fuconolactonase
MWGSDWPVVELAGSYADWFEQAELLLAGLSSADRARVFGGNAAHFYRLDNG